MAVKYPFSNIDEVERFIQTVERLTQTKPSDFTVTLDDDVVGLLTEAVNTLGMGIPVVEEPVVEEPVVEELVEEPVVEELVGELVVEPTVLVGELVVEPTVNTSEYEMDIILKNEFVTNDDLDDFDAFESKSSEDYFVIGSLDQLTYGNDNWDAAKIIFESYKGTKYTNCITRRQAYIAWMRTGRFTLSQMHSMVTDLMKNGFLRPQNDPTRRDLREQGIEYPRRTILFVRYKNYTDHFPPFRKTPMTDAEKLKWRDKYVNKRNGELDENGNEIYSVFPFNDSHLSKFKKFLAVVEPLLEKLHDDVPIPEIPRPKPKLVKM